MAVTIDSLVPNSACLEEYKPVVPESNPKPVSKSNKLSPCIVETVLHVSDNASEHHVKFQRGESGFVLNPSLNNPSITGLVLRAGFDPQNSVFQGALNQSIGLKWFWRGNYTNYLNGEQKPPPIPEAEQFLQNLQDFIHLEYFPQDSTHNVHLNNLLFSLFSLPEPTQKFVTDNLKLLLSPDVANRFTPETIQREKMLLATLNFSSNVRSRFSFVKGDAEIEKQLNQNIRETMTGIFTGKPDMNEWISHTRSLAFVADGISVNLYELYQEEFAKLKNEGSLQIDTASSLRFETFLRWMQQAARKKELEYARLSPEEALRKSLYDHLLLQDPAKTLSPYAMAVLGAQNFSPEWFDDSEKLKRIMDVVFENVRITEDAQGKLQIDPDKFKFLGFQVDTNVEAEVNERREFAAGYLAVLTYYFGDPPQASAKWNLFHSGSLSENEIQLSEEHNKTLRATFIALKNRLKSSVSHTETNLPLLEGALCLVGTGVTLWGVADERDRINVKTYAGSAIAGVGCSSLITHYTISQGQPDLYWRDLIGGGVGLALGLGIPFLLDHDWNKKNENKKEPSTPPVIPHYEFPPIDHELFPNPLPKPPLPFPLRPRPAPDPEGRNPSDGFGP